LSWDAAPLAQANLSKPAMKVNALVEGIRACYDYAEACLVDADADLAEPHTLEMVRCIRLCLECADVCLATGAMLLRQTSFDPATARGTLQACVQTCKVCGDDCEHHAQHGIAHCQTCMKACRRCEQACTTILTLLTPVPV
jgi:hypothetical protein